MKSSIFVTCLVFCTAWQVCTVGYSQFDFKKAEETSQRESSNESVDLFSDVEIDHTITEFMKNKIVGLGLVIVHDGKLVYQRGYGYEDLAAGIQVSPTQTRFRWASISKTMTGTIAVMADSARLIDLDENVEDLYPEYRVPGTFFVGEKIAKLPLEARVMTLRQILSHTSGIQHYGSGDFTAKPPGWMTLDPTINTGMEWALDYWVDNPLQFPPGSTYGYSTPAFNLAGVILEQNTGLSFEALTDQMIAQPCGMSTLRPDKLWDPAPRRAVGYYYPVDSRLPKKETEDDITWKLAGGGFVSSVHDLGLYARELMGNSLLSETEKNRMWTRQQTNDLTTINRGLGWEVRSISGGRKRVRHGGAQRKGQSWLVMYPEDGLAIAIMTNASYKGSTSGTKVDLKGLGYLIEDIVRDRMTLGQPIIQTPTTLLSQEPLTNIQDINFDLITDSYRLGR